MKTSRKQHQRTHGTRSVELQYGNYKRDGGIKLQLQLLHQLLRVCHQYALQRSVSQPCRAGWNRLAGRRRRQRLRRLRSVRRRPVVLLRRCARQRRLRRSVRHRLYAPFLRRCDAHLLLQRARLHGSVRHHRRERRPEERSWRTTAAQRVRITTKRKPPSYSHVRNKATAATKLLVAVHVPDRSRALRS